MLDILDDYLSSVASPQQRSSIREAIALFDRFEIENYEDDYVSQLMVGDDADTGVTLDAIIQITRTNQFQIFQEHGLVIDENAAISLNNIFLKGLLLIPDYDDAAGLYDILKTDTDSLDIIAQVIGLVTGHTADELLPSIENADSRILQLMVEKLDKATMFDMVEDPVLKQERIRRYNQFIHRSEIPHLKLAYLLERGMDVGHPFIVYLNLIGQDFDEMEVPAIANELVAMTIISSDGSDNPRAAIQEHIERFVSSMEKITKIDVAVGELLLKIAKHE
jgi:hypothetical protein